MISNVLIVLSNTMLDAVNNAQRDNGYPSEVSWDLAKEPRSYFDAWFLLVLGNGHLNIDVA